MWHVLALYGEVEAEREDGQRLLLHGLEPVERRPGLPAESLRDRVVQDYEVTGLSLAAHPMSLVRERLEEAGAIDAKSLREMPQARRVRVAGLVLVRQRPATAKGLMFYTLEDETGVMNLVVRPRVYERYRQGAHHSVCVLAEGTVERQGEVVHVQTRRILDLSNALDGLVLRRRDFR